MTPHRWDRRSFVKTAALAGAAVSMARHAEASEASQGAPRAAPRSGSRTAPLTPAAFAARLRGPIVAIPTPFDRQGQIDRPGLERMVQRALAHGIDIFALTAGDSQFDLLAYEEVQQLTRMLVEAVGGRGIVIAATGGWWTARTIEFARFAESIGATALQLLRPPRVDDDGTLQQVRDVAAATRLPLVLHGNYAIPLLERLSGVEAVAALKEDVDLAYLIDTTVRFGKRFNCFSGGSLQWFLAGQPYGTTAYYDALATFAPGVSARFWAAVEAGDQAAQTAIVTAYDYPFIQRFSAAFWHASLEHFGVAPRALRAPQRTFDDEEMREVRAFYERIGLRPSRDREESPR